MIQCTIRWRGNSLLYILYEPNNILSCLHDDPASTLRMLFLLSIISVTYLQCLWKDNNGSIITASSLGLRSSGSCVSSRVIFECVWNCCEEGDCWFRCRDQKRVFIHVDAYISQITVDHGFQL